MISSLNSFDSNIQSFDTGFNGVYEPIRENKYIIIKIYTSDTLDTLQIYHVDDPAYLDNNSYNTIDTFNINVGQSIIAVPLKSRFVKINITTTGSQSSKRIYDTILTEIEPVYELNMMSKGSYILINGTYNGTASPYYSNSLDLSQKKISVLSFYGDCSINSVITLQYSNNNSDFYDTQYSYTINTSTSNFGFNISGCPKYLRLKIVPNSVSSFTIKAFVDYS